MDCPSMADWTSAALAQMTHARLRQVQCGKFSSNAYNWHAILEIIC